MLKDQKGYKAHLMNVKKTGKLPGLENYSYFEDNAFTALRTDAAF